MQKQKSCGFVLFRNDEHGRKYLLLKYDGGHWGLVKGMVEEGEEELATALREAKEETGVTDIDTVQGFRETISYSYIWESKKIHKTVVYFLGKTNSHDVVLSHEHTEYRWLSFEDAKKRLSFANDKNILSKAEKILAQNQKIVTSF